MKRFYLILLIFFFTVSSALAGEEFGVYIKVVEKAQGSFDEVSSAVESGLKSAGWEVLGTYDSGLPDGCEFRSRVIIFSSQAYASSIMGNGVKAAFAMPLRAGIYEDETGINVAVVNPASINRTIIHETKLNDFSLSISNSIVDVIAEAVSANTVKKQIGQLRKKGMVGGMGGGRFVKKIEEVYTAGDGSDSTLRKVMEDVKKGILGNRKNWQLIYTYDLSAGGAVIFGVSKAKTEARGFTIAGEKRSSDSYKFPGIDHGAAYPIEVIVYKDEGKIKVVTLDEMYRMKMYFQDAGMWAFMKNMRMPGEIEDEIVEMSISELDR